MPGSGLQLAGCCQIRGVISFLSQTTLAMKEERGKSFEPPRGSRLFLATLAAEQGRTGSIFRANTGFSIIPRRSSEWEGEIFQGSKSFLPHHPIAFFFPPNWALSLTRRRPFCTRHTTTSTYMTQRYALTLGEQSEAHTGGRIYGKGLAVRGYSVDELCAFRDALGEQALVVNLTDALSAAAPRAGNEAAVLHIKGGIALLSGVATFADEMLHEQQAHSYDTRFWDPRSGQVRNKRARYSIVFGEESSAPSADFKQSSVIAYRDVPRFQQLRALLPTFFGEKAANLESEGNHYYHKNAGISFHGDRCVLLRVWFAQYWVGCMYSADNVSISCVLRICFLFILQRATYHHLLQPWCNDYSSFCLACSVLE
jgi:hypothetical protein